MVYIDTSVFGGVFDEIYAAPSKEFFRQARLGLFYPVISPIVQAEIENAPLKVRKHFDRIVSISEFIQITDAALSLREAYLGSNIVSQKYSNDALHVALATVSACIMIVSWNFRHIVHSEKIPLYNAINILNGYNQIKIFSPSEVIKYE